MPIFVQWKWVERTKSFLVIFHFWDDGKKSNLRMRKKESVFETIHAYKNRRKGEFVSATSAPYYILSPPENKNYLTWAPSHPEFCFLTEVLTYANLVNGLKEKRNLRPILEGRQIGGKHSYTFEIHADLADSMSDGTMVVFDEGIYFKICPEYIDYLRRLLKPYLSE